MATSFFYIDIDIYIDIYKLTERPVVLLNAIFCQVRSTLLQSLQHSFSLEQCSCTRTLDIRSQFQNHCRKFFFIVQIMFKCLSIPQHALWMPGIADFTRRFGKYFRLQHFSFKIGVIDHKVGSGFGHICNSKKNISELKNNIARGKIAFNRTTGRSVNL